MLNTLPFWEELTQSQKDLFTRHSTTKKFEKNTPIYNILKGCVGLMLIKSGSIRVYMVSEDGREITLYRLYPGDICILSASCALNQITFDISIDSVTDSEIIQIDAGSFTKVLNENVYLENFAYRMTTERFSDVMWAMQQILFMSFDKRLAIFLIDEAVKTGSDEIKMTHEQIAKLMGSAREVVSRMLKYFSTEGLVELSRGGVKILDRGKLRELL